MIGQEFGSTLPNVKTLSLEMYYTFTKSEFYKKIIDDFNKKQI